MDFKYIKCIGLFIITLIISLNFSGPCLYAEENKSLTNNNSTDISNTTDYIQVKLNGRIPYYDSPSQLGEDLNKHKITQPWMDKPVMHTPEYKPPKFDPPHIRELHWYNSIAWAADCLEYSAYCAWYSLKVAAYDAWYAIEVIVYDAWFILQMVAWFFVIIAWVPVALYDCAMNIEDFGRAFKLIYWCFKGNDNLKYIDVSRTISIENKISVKTNSIVNNSTNNNTTNIHPEPLIFYFNNSTSNNSTTNNTTTTTYIKSDIININKYLLDHDLSSLSNSSLENVSDDQLFMCSFNLDKQNHDINGTLLVINNIFEVINNVIVLIDNLVNIIIAISLSLSIPTEGESVTTAISSNIAKETSKTTSHGILQNIVLEKTNTMLSTIISKIINDDYYIQNGKGNARALILANRIQTTANYIKDNEGKFKIGKDFFGVIRDIVRMLCTDADLIWSISYDIEKDKIKEEQAYRRAHHIMVS
jgi:hypothetical protein